MVCVCHFFAGFVGNVPERLFFVYADQPSVGICYKIAAVAVIVSQQPVCNMFPLYLLYLVSCQAFGAVLLPRLKVEPVRVHVNFLLVCAKLAAYVSGADFDGRVRIHNALYLVTSFLHIGPELFRCAAFGLRRFEKPFRAAAVLAQVHFSGTSQVRQTFVFHSLRHLQAARDGRCCRIRYTWPLCLTLCRLYYRRGNLPILNRTPALRMCRWCQPLPSKK